MSKTDSFFILTDSACDLPVSLYGTYENFAIAPLTFIIDGEIDPPMDSRTFYDRLRAGSSATTSQVPTGKYLDCFRYAAEKGMDVLYVGFSSGLSGCVSGARIAETMAADEYPERRFVVVDSLAASCGLGCLVDKAVELRDAGKSLDETADWLESNKLKLHHWYTVDDLNFLKRGGRVSAAAAWFGMKLNIKPVMNMNELGKLIPIEKIVGRKRAIKTLFKKMQELGVNQAAQKIFISHGDCMDEVEPLVEMIRAEWNIQQFVINNVGNVIGSHTGPGVIALYFFGNNR